MTHDFLTADAAGATTNDDLILLETARGGLIEMTRDNQLQLEREMAGMLGNPLAALMAQVAIEYRDMAAGPARRETGFI
jgi:hypothetical protein